MQRLDLLSALSSPISLFFFVFGALLGSFFNVCIYRIPRHIFWKSHRSFCPACDTPIPFWHNIPILSWVILRGKAACCGAKIPVQYPLVELGTGLLMVLVYWIFPFFMNSSGSPLVIDSDAFLRFMHAAIFSSLLLICSVIDFEHQIIPDVLSLPMIAVSPLIAWLHPDLDIKSSLLGVLLGGGLFYAIAWAYVLIRKEYGLGLGDVKLLGAIGGWLGWQAILTTIFWASILGAVTGLLLMIVTGSRDMKLKLPFGPFLSIAAIVFHLFGNSLTDIVISFK